MIKYGKNDKKMHISQVYFYAYFQSHLNIYLYIYICIYTRNQ